MKKSLQFSIALLLSWCFSLVGMQQARASHAQGGQLTYEFVRLNPNGTQTYRVTCRFFRDCSGIAAPTTLTLNCRNTLPNVCSGGTTVSATLMPGLFTPGSPYCGSNPGGPSPCGSAIVNYETAKYEGTVDLLPAANWTLSVEENARPNVANLNTAGTLRLEATLNSLLTIAPGQTQVVANTSPQYTDQDIPVPFVCWQQRSTVSFSATEPDGDSLVYNLDTPMSGCNTFDTYSASPGGGVIVLSQQPPCVAIGLPSSNYTPTFPIPSYTLTGNCPVKTAVPSFDFNATAGTFSFTPAIFDATSAPAVGNNKYAVIGKVTEFRRLPGSNRRYRVGSVRRDFLIIVIDCGANVVPPSPTGTVVTVGSGGDIIQRGDTTEVTVRTCNFTRVRFDFTDPNPGQLLTVTVPGNINAPTPTSGGISYLQEGDIGSFVLSRNGTSTPGGTFFFQPAAATAGTVIRIPFRIEDNACPIKGVQNKVIVVRVVAGSYATAAAAAGTGNVLTGVTPTTVCGGSLTINGTVLRPDSVRQVAAGRTVLQQYRYRWSTSRNGPVVDSTQNITVTPTQNTRYYLRIVPTIGFGTNGGGCGDTTSILIRVAPRVTNTFDVVRTISSRPDPLPGQAPNAPVPPLTFVLQNTTAALPAAFTNDFRLGGYTWTYQRVKDGAGNMVNDMPVVFSTQRDPAVDALVLSKGGEYTITLRSSLMLTATGAPATAMCPTVVATRTVVVPDLPVPNIITPNGDGLNETFVVRPELQGGKLEIYNRWGRKVEEISNYKNSWNGNAQPEGVYYYYITDPAGNKTKGWVEISRTK